MTTLPDLLSALGAEHLPLDEPLTAAVSDPETGGMLMSEVRLGTESEEFLSCAVIRFDADERRESVCTLRAEPEADDWRVISFIVTGKIVTIREERALAFMRAMMEEIRGGRVPGLNTLLQEHLGLKLPITGYR